MTAWKLGVRKLLMPDDLQISGIQSVLPLVQTKLVRLSQRVSWRVARRLKKGAVQTAPLCSPQQQRDTNSAPKKIHVRAALRYFV